VGFADAAREVLERLDEKPTLSRHIAAGRQLGALHREHPELFTDVNVFVIRNFTIEPVEPFLVVAGFRSGIHLRASYSGYDPTADDVPAGDDATPTVVIVALRVEELAPAFARDFLSTDARGAQELATAAVDRVHALVRGVRERSGAPVLVHNFVPPAVPAAGLADSQDPAGQVNLVRRMNVDLAERIAGIDGAHLLDVEHLLAGLGLAEVTDTRGERVSDAPFSRAALETIGDFHARHIRALRGPAVKCVVVDCDGTLWGGVVGEDGIEGIALGETGAGRRFRDFQQQLLDLRRLGTVLAICSKNEEADVLEVLSKHPDCLLSEADFAAMRVNWEDKAENVVAIAHELGLGLEHLLFVDDNPVECDWIRTRLPEVRVVAAPAGDPDASGSLQDLGLFDSLVLTDEDRSRTEMYRAESMRKTALTEVASVDDYLRSLEMVATVGLAVAERLPRLSQLTLKTNQFNLTTRRHDLSTLAAMAEDPQTRVIWLELRDRFGTNGVICCGIVRMVDDATALIDTLLISCRVLGRQLEFVAVSRLEGLARSMGASVLVGEYIPSPRNAQVADLYTRLGFDGPEAGAEGQVWRRSLDAEPLSVPDWFEVVDLEGVGP
jgi:FkbH-like protein